jgi:mRNA interferase RelE/StbE
MSYRVTIIKRALKELQSLPTNININIAEAIDALKEDPRPPGCKTLKGDTEYIWRIRVNNYRVLYTIEDTIKIVEVRKVGHRKDVYK